MARPTVIKTTDEIAREFVDCYGQLLRSLEAYQQGHTDEAVRLAGSVYIFVHDAGAISSLLSLVGRKAVPFFNTARKLEAANTLTENPLTILRLTAGGGKPGAAMFPRLDERDSDLTDQPFAEWWEAPVMRDVQLRHFTRKELVTALRNQHGGGHVSKTANEKIADLSRKNSMGWEVSGAAMAGTAPLLGIERASVAQIAHELRRTIEGHCGDIIGRR